jgi:hypothetical protein
VPKTIAHPSFTSWWQELHDHIFNVAVHPLCLELMPDFHPIPEVINLFSLFFNHAPFYLSGFCHFLHDTVPAPLARTISYNIAGPFSALGYQSPTLA